MKTNLNTSWFKDFYSNPKKTHLFLIAIGCMAFAYVTVHNMYQYPDVEDTLPVSMTASAIETGYHLKDRVIHYEDFEKTPSLGEPNRIWKINHFNKNCKKSRNGHWARLVRAGGYIYGPQLDFAAEKNVDAYEYSGWFNTPEGYTNGRVIIQVLGASNNTIYHKSVAIESTGGEWKQVKVFMNLMKIRQQKGLEREAWVRINVSIRNEDLDHPIVVDDLTMTPRTLRTI